MTSRYRKRWSKNELILAFSLYCKTLFGKLHSSNPDIIKIAGILGRTPDAVAMKLVNFASLDPIQKARNISGLSHSSKVDQEIFNEFSEDWESLIVESQTIYDTLLENNSNDNQEAIDNIPQFERTESTAKIRIRLIQSFFREVILSSYDNKCSICKISLPELIIASHIIPWSKCKERRGDPTNGLALCSLHDRAFDRGLLTVDKSFRIVLSKRVKETSKPKLFMVAFSEIENRGLTKPSRFQPDQNALEYHRENVFLG